jgi:monomeric sarcosine oxidase
VIIGAGIMGSAAAYHLALDGRRVLVLEQFQIGHTRGSSHGGSRIIRYTHDNIDYTQWMPATFELWRALEVESGERLLQLTGGLYIGLESDPFLCGAQKALSALQIPYSVMTAPEASRFYPQFRFHPEWIVLSQEQSGILAATHCVKTLIKQAIRRGAYLLEHATVYEIIPQADGVRIRYTHKGTSETVYADQAIITAGPWAQRLLKPLLCVPLPLKSTHQQIAYFRVEKPQMYAIGCCPVYIFFNCGPGLYGFPIFEYPGHIKIALELLDTVIDPDQEPVINQGALSELKHLVAELLIGVSPQPVKVESCRYTETPTRDFIIDRHPNHPQILFATGFSGRGFKHAIAIGRLLADLAASSPGAYQSNFWLSGFALQSAKTKLDRDVE